STGRSLTARVPSTEYRVLSTEYRVQSIEYLVLSTECPIFPTKTWPMPRTVPRTVGFGESHSTAHRLDPHPNLTWVPGRIRINMQSRGGRNAIVYHCR